MKYLGETDYHHGRESRAGILLTNLGTPDAPEPRALRRYLKEFLWDPRVIEYPRWFWWLVLNGVILNIRPARSAKLYQNVWTPEGSPLLSISRRQAQALDAHLQRIATGPIKVVLAMRYGNPSIHAGLEELRLAGVRRLAVLPLYPQYSATTTGSTFDAVADVLKTWRWLPELRFIDQYSGHGGYIQAMMKRIRAYWKEHGRGQLLLFSFHGIPKRYLLNGDPYHCECHKTARLLAGALGLGDEQWRVTFQSRFGREEWLQPYTDETMRRLPGEGVRSLDVFCPGFAADCLETLEEIAMQNRELFLAAGGERFHYIPALNDMPEHIEALGDLVSDHGAGWPELAKDGDLEAAARTADLSRRRALAVGAKQ